MYFIKIAPLKARMRDRTMTDREALPYFVVFMGLTCLLCTPMMTQPATRLDVLSGLMGTLCIIGGTIYTYAKNGGRNGYDFIQKSIVLGWVVVIRVLAIMIPSLVVVGFLKPLIGQPIDRSSWVEVLLVVGFTLLYFQRLGRHLADTNRNDGEPSPPPLPRVPAGRSEGEG